MSKPSIILVAPQMGANIGAAARAMCNFGLTDLRLVKPRDGWPNTEADRNASGAFELMEEVKIFDTLSDAISDLHFTFATTARSRDLAKPVYNSVTASKQAKLRIDGDQRVGFVFGAERAGLSNDDIALANAIIHIDASPEFSSLNLAQAVLLISYEYSKASGPKMRLAGHVPAEQEYFESFMKRFEEELEAHQFFRSEGLEPTMKRNIRTMLTRAELSEQEINTFHGMITALIGRREKQSAK